MIETAKNPKKPGEWKVYLSGKKVGVIVRDDKNHTFCYLPGGSVKDRGHPFTTLEACVKSLETE